MISKEVSSQLGTTASQHFTKLQPAGNDKLIWLDNGEDPLKRSISGMKSSDT